MARPLLIAALALAGCTATIPDGQIVCSVAAPDCPDDFVCCPAPPSGGFDGVCSRSACGDAGPGDAGSSDAGFDASLDAGVDAGSDAGFDAGPPPIPAEIAAGTDHSCLRLSDGTVECWGSNASGQLGQGVETVAPQTVPIAVMDLRPGALEIEAAAEASCARFADGVQCWGSNQVAFSVGPIGSDVMRSPLPRDVELNDPTPHQLAMGAYHACAIVGTARTLECWGHNADGQLGIGSRMASAIPVAVPGLTAVADVCAGQQHTCAALGDGTLYCWGGAARGQLGIGEPGMPSDRTSPTRVDLTQVIELECGYLHTCAITDDGTTRRAYCWGENRRGETQQDELTSPVLEPTLFRDSRGADVERIAIGGSSFFTVTRGFTLVWGTSLSLSGFGDNGDDQLGLGVAGPDFTSALLPTLEVGRTIVDFSAGGSHACAIDEPSVGRRRVLCWGYGANGRLGNAGERPSDRPVPVFGYDGT